MGGNVEVDGIAAQRLDLNKISRSTVTTRIDKTLRAVNNAFNKKYGTPLWSPRLINNKQFLSGSAFHFFNSKITDDEFRLVKASVGDIDTMVDKDLAIHVKDFLDQSKGKQFGRAKLIGYKPNPGNDTYISLWQLSDPDVRVQIDLELVDYENGLPSEWSKFSHSSSLEDLSEGVKGVFHKYLLRAITHKDAKERYVQLKTKLKKIVAADLAFAVSGGIREKFTPVYEPVTGRQLMHDGLPVYKEIPPSASIYITGLPKMFEMLFGRRGKKEEVKKLGSFVGCLELIKKFFTPEEQERIYQSFVELLYGKSAQQLYKGEPELDRREKEIALMKISSTLGVGGGDIEQIKNDYYSKYKAESLTESAETPNYKRQSIKHLYAPGSSMQMSDKEFLAAVGSIHANGGTLDGIPITLKVDGAGIRFGRDEKGKPFLMTSKVTKPLYAEDVGVFEKYSTEKGAQAEVVQRAKSYDHALDAIVNSGFIKALPKDSIVNAEMLYNEMAVKTDAGLKFVNISYDPKKLGKTMTLVPLAIRRYSTGEDLSSKYIDKLVSKSNHDVKFVSATLEHSGIDVKKIVEPVAFMDEALKVALGSRQKDNKLKEKAKEILNNVRQSLSNAIITSKKLKGLDALGKNLEGIVIAFPNGILGKVTSGEMKEAVAKKQAKSNRHKVAVVTAGSFAGHIGHQKVVDAVFAAAKKLKGDAFVYISDKVGPDDPIPGEVKLATWRKMYPEHAVSFQLITSPDGVSTPSPVKKIEKELVLPSDSPYNKVILMVGTDRYDGFKKWMDTLEKRMKDPKALAKYGGTQNEVDFETVSIDRGSALGSIDASFTELRNILKDPALSLKQKLAAWQQGFGNKLDSDWIKKLIMVAAKGMNMSHDDLEEEIIEELDIGEDIRSEIEKAQAVFLKKGSVKGFAIGFSFADGPVFATEHLLKRIAERGITASQVADILEKVKKQYGDRIAALPNVDLVVKYRSGLGFGLRKVLQPDDSHKYFITTGHQAKNIGNQGSYIVDEDVTDLPLLEPLGTGEDDLNVHFHDELNPALFANGKLSPLVKQKLLDIAEDFKASIGVPLPSLQDITVSGSNAAYTYTPSSDIDLHLIVDMSAFENDHTMKELFDAKKFQYNEQHDYKIKGYDVEVYVQDANEDHVSQGVYSVLNDTWIQEPKKVVAQYDESSTREKYDQIKYLILKAIHVKDYHLADKLRKTIKKYRQVGLHSTGEFGPENLAFKALRANGYIKKLYTLLNSLKDNEFSLESAQPLTEIDMSPGALQKFSGSAGAQQTIVGFEFEMIYPDVLTGSEELEDYNDDQNLTSRTVMDLQHELSDFFAEPLSRIQSIVERHIDDELNDYIESEFRKELDDDSIRSYMKYDGLADDEINDAIESQNAQYDNAVDSLRDDFYNSWDDLRGFLEDQHLVKFSDWARRFDLIWPYHGEGGPDSEEISDGILQSIASNLRPIVRAPVYAKAGYHAFKKREAGIWYLETDSSIEPDIGDAGLELISPPLPYADAVSKLDTIINWMHENGVKTDSSTGFHMNVSIPHMDQLDHVKLIMFLGDQYLLKQFGRQANYYTKSLTQVMKTNMNGNIVKARAIKTLQQGLLKAAAKIVGDNLIPRGEKMVSINIKEKYIEFRIAGGNYLDKIDIVKNTLMRYVRVMNLAADPNEAKAEYTKKLYKFIASLGSDMDHDTIKWFAMVASGAMTKEELKRRLNYVNRERTKDKPTPGAVWTIAKPDGTPIKKVETKHGVTEFQPFTANSLGEAEKMVERWFSMSAVMVPDYKVVQVKESKQTGLAGYIAESDKPFVWQKEEPSESKKKFTDWQWAHIMGGHLYEGDE